MIQYQPIYKDMIKKNRRKTRSIFGHCHLLRNDAKKIAIGLFACIAFSMNAQASKENEFHTEGSIVQSIKAQLPIETPTTGTIVSVEVPITPLTVTTDMGNVPEQNMRAYAQAPEMFKTAIMGNFRAMGDIFVSLAEAAFNAGIPFAVHLTSITFPEGFTITFNGEDLEKGLLIKPSDN